MAHEEGRRIAAVGCILPVGFEYINQVKQLAGRSADESYFLQIGRIVDCGERCGCWREQRCKGVEVDERHGFSSTEWGRTALWYASYLC